MFVRLRRRGQNWKFVLVLSTSRAETWFARGGPQADTPGPCLCRNWCNMLLVRCLIESSWRDCVDFEKVFRPPRAKLFRYGCVVNVLSVGIANIAHIRRQASTCQIGLKTPTYSLLFFFSKFNCADEDLFISYNFKNVDNILGISNKAFVDATL